MNETNREIPVCNILTMVDNAVHTCTTGEENISKQQVVKLGAPNAQLILLPPYQPSSENQSNSKQLINAQCQASQDGNVTSKQCVWQEMYRQQKHNQPMHTETCKPSKIIKVVHKNSQIQHNESPEALTSPIYKVHGTYYQKKSQPSHVKCLHTLPSSSPSDIQLILEQSRFIESINASVLDLKTSHGNMNQLLMGIQKQQQQVIEAQTKVQNSLIEENRDDKHDEVLVQSNNSMVSLDVSDQQLSGVYKYVNQCEDVLQSTEINKQRLKPWRVVDVLSNQVVDSALRSVVTELDFESLLSNMYRLEFQ